MSNNKFKTRDCCSRLITITTTNKSFFFTLFRSYTLRRAVLTLGRPKFPSESSFIGFDRICDDMEP